MLQNIKEFFQSPFNSLFAGLTVLFTLLTIWIMKDKRKSKTWCKYLPYAFGLILALLLVFKTRIVQILPSR